MSLKAISHVFLYLIGCFQNEPVRDPLNDFSAQDQLVIHAQMLQELKISWAHSEKPAESLPLDKKSRYTQSEAYLSVYKPAIENLYGEKIKKHQPLIDQILAKEKELSDTHYVFYHAHEKELMVLHDFLKEVRSYLALVPKHPYFTFLRSHKNQIPELKNANNYLDSNTDIDDWKEAYRGHMLSVNLSLFGNHEFYDSCTIYYFFKNKSLYKGGLSKRLTTVVEQYGFDQKYIKEILALTDHLASETGNLLQIFIPKTDVDQLVYLAHPGGSPYKNPIIDQCYDTKKKRHTSISPILELYCDAPFYISNLERLQARILFFEPLFTPDSRIKIVRYNTVPEKNMRTYEAALADIVRRMLADSLKSIDSHHTEPLFKLNLYRKANHTLVD